MVVTVAGSGGIRIIRRRTPAGRIRTFTILSLPDARTWDDLAGRLGARLERRLSDRVVANRVRTTPIGWTLERIEEAYARARAVTAGWNGRALLADVSDFYGSVRPEVAEMACLVAGSSSRDSRRVRELLERWAEQGCRGLPIGPRGSAVIANAVLLPVDEALGSRPFARWVDDYRIAVASQDDRNLILARLDEELGKLGLGRSQTKTRMAEPDDPWPGSASALARIGS